MLAFLLVGIILSSPTHGALQTIAITGTPALAMPAAEFSIGENVFQLARLSNNGMVAYRASLNPDTVGMSIDNNDVIFRFDDGNSNVGHWPQNC
jgi:hypothetical protein